MKPPEESASSNPSIGKLPANVICLILTFLPMKQAVRTSILSTQWRHHWRRIPQLVFGEDFASIRSRKVMLEIYQALLGHEGPVNKFELAFWFLSDGHVPYQLPETLHNLKVLEASRLLLGRLPEAEVLFCLIRSSPNLRKLTIVHDDDLYCPVLMAIDSLQMLLEHSHHFGVSCLQRLEEFDIKNTRGTRVEQDLLKFVLATALQLKRVSIKPKKDLSSDTMLKFIVEVTQYKRISKDAEVKYVLANLD